MFTHTCCEAQHSRARKGWHGARGTVFPINPMILPSTMDSSDKLYKTYRRIEVSLSRLAARRGETWRRVYQHTRFNLCFAYQKTKIATARDSSLGEYRDTVDKGREENVLLFMTVILTALLSGSGSKSRSSRSFEVSWMQIVPLEIVGCVVTWWPVY